MEHLFDTCTIKNEIKTGDNILNVIDTCKMHSDCFSITNEILRELKPPQHLKNECVVKYNIANAISNSVCFLVKSHDIKMITVNEDKSISENFKKIRNDHYKWMYNKKYCKMLINNGNLKLEDYNSENFKFRDIGECSLIAVALVCPQNYIIISEDNGKKFAHPYENIFEAFRKDGINIVKFKDWPLNSDDDRPTN